MSLLTILGCPMLTFVFLSISQVRLWVPVVRWRELLTAWGKEGPHECSLRGDSLILLLTSNVGE